MTTEDMIDLVTRNTGKSLIMLATADYTGTPHITAADSLRRNGEGQIAVQEWFCPETVANSLPGRPIALVIWDPTNDRGHQLIGRIAKIESIAMLDGYLEGEGTGEGPLAAIPQEERSLLIDVDKVMAFSRAPHNDVVE